MRERSGSEVVAETRIPSNNNMVTPPGYDQSGQGAGGPVAGNGGSGGNHDAALAVAASQPIIAPHDAQYQDQAQFECDKRAVYK